MIDVKDAIESGNIASKNYDTLKEIFRPFVDLYKLFMEAIGAKHGACYSIWLNSGKVLMDSNEWASILIVKIYVKKNSKKKIMEFKLERDYTLWCNDFEIYEGIEEYIFDINQAIKEMKEEIEQQNEKIIDTINIVQASLEL